MQKQISVPKDFLDNFYKRLDSLNKKYLKKGILTEPFKVVSVEPEKLRVAINNQETEIVNYVSLTLEYKQPNIGNYEVVAIIEHENETTCVYSDNENLVKKYLNTPKTLCEHCHSERVRKNQFVLRNTTTNEVKIVGSSCLQDFTGIKIANYNLFKEAEDLDDWEEEYFREAKRYPAVKLNQILTSTIKEINEHGFFPTSALNSTAHFIMNDSKSLKPIDNPEEETKFRNWLDNQKDSSFILNCKSILSNEYFPITKVPFIVGLINTYLRTKNNVNVSFDNSEWIGNENEYITFNCKLINKKPFENRFGMSNVYTFLANGKDLVTWFSQKNLEVKENEEITVKAKVSNHTFYNSNKQTIVKLLKQVEEPKQKELQFENEAEKAIEEFLEYCNK